MKELEGDDEAAAPGSGAVRMEIAKLSQGLSTEKQVYSYFYRGGRERLGLKAVWMREDRLLPYSVVVRSEPARGGEGSVYGTGAACRPERLGCCGA